MAAPRFYPFSGSVTNQYNSAARTKSSTIVSMVPDSLLPLDIGANIIYNYDKAMFKVGKIRRDLEGSLICGAKVHNDNINLRFLVQIPPIIILLSD